MMEGNKETLAYIIIGVLLAWGINQGMAAALSTDMPVVAVESNSMVPVFYKGDILVLEGIGSDGPQVGDVIVYSVQGRSIPIVHRIVKENPDGSYQTKGDANNGQLEFEYHVPRESMHGKVVAIVPYLGWVKLGATQYVLPNALYVILAAGLIALVYYGRRLI
jgi:signal peptidase I